MNTENLTAGLAQAVMSSVPETSAEAMKEARKGLLDFTAAAFAGRRDKGVEKLVKLAEEEGGVPIAPLIGRNQKPRRPNPRSLTDSSHMRLILTMFILM